MLGTAIGIFWAFSTLNGNGPTQCREQNKKKIREKGFGILHSLFPSSIHSFIAKWKIFVTTISICSEKKNENKQNTIDNGLNANCAIWFDIKCVTRLCRRMLWLDCFSSSSFHLSHSLTPQPPIAAQHLLTAKELWRKTAIQILVDERNLDDWHSRFAFAHKN